MDDATLKSRFRGRAAVPAPAFETMIDHPRSVRLRTVGVAASLAVVALAAVAIRSLTSDPAPSVAELMAWTPATDVLLPEGSATSFTLDDGGMSP